MEKYQTIYSSCKPMLSSVANIWKIGIFRAEKTDIVIQLANQCNISAININNGIKIIQSVWK